MGTEEAAVAGQTPRSAGRFRLSLVFLLAMASALVSFAPFAAFALAYGPSVAESMIQADVAYLLWLVRSAELAFLLIFYRLGKGLDFRGRYLQLAVLSFAGVLVGALPQLVSVQTTQLRSSLIFAFEGVGLSNTISLFVSMLTSVLQEFAFPFAGLALSFLREGQPDTAPSPSAWPGERRRLSPRVLVVGTALAIAAYLASGLTDVLGSRFLQSGQFAFLSSTFVIFSPYDRYAYDFFYPLMFFVAFYFLGKRTDMGGSGRIAFATSVFAAGALGFLLGTPLAYSVRALAAPPGQPFPQFSFGLSYLPDALVRGFYVLALGLAAASLGFVRNMENPIDQDRRVVTALGALVLVLFAVSVLLGVSPVSTATTA
jgi:hypothetical protein